MKMHATEDGPRVPLIISAPGIVKIRGATKELVEFSDLFPTLIDYSESRLPDSYALDGKSLRPFLSGEKDTHRDWILSYIATARMARTRDWVLEAVDPVYGSNEGRLYFSNGEHIRSKYTLVEDTSSPAAREAHKGLMKILEYNPWPDRSDPKVAAEIRSYDQMPYKHYLETGKPLPEINSEVAHEVKSKI
jgi:hypothetical protein